MKRFLSTTAVIMTLSGAASAETHATGYGTTEYQPSDFFASEMIGMSIYSTQEEIDANTMVPDGAELEWDNIGEVNDIILSKDGSVRAVVLGVGGFLGMGERDVTVSMDTIMVVEEQGESTDRFLVVDATQEMLENAPEFEWPAGYGIASMDNVGNGTSQSMDAASNATENFAEDAESTLEAMVRPNVTIEGYSEADAETVASLSSEEITRSSVYGANEDVVGEIDALLLDADGNVSEAVINVGGFLGLAEKPVAVGFDKILVLQSDDGESYRFYIDSTEEVLENMPEYDS